MRVDGPARAHARTAPHQPREPANEVGHEEEACSRGRPIFQVGRVEIVIAEDVAAGVVEHLLVEVHAAHRRHRQARHRSNVVLLLHHVAHHLHHAGVGAARQDPRSRLPRGLAQAAPEDDAVLWAHVVQILRRARDRDQHGRRRQPPRLAEQRHHVVWGRVIGEGAPLGGHALGRGEADGAKGGGRPVVHLEPLQRPLRDHPPLGGAHVYNIYGQLRRSYWSCRPSPCTFEQ